MSESSLPEVVWRVRTLDRPRVLRHCPRCERTCAFVSSDRFRTNANQRLLDVWLLYRCAVCEQTWKRDVVRRTPPERIAPERLAAFQANDAGLAWTCAFAPDPALRLDAASEVVVERPVLAPTPLRIRLEVPWPCGGRLDRLLVAELGWSRGELERRVRRGALSIEPLGARALRRPPRDGTVLLLARE